MSNLKHWIRAARPRTVLLSFSGILMGGILTTLYPKHNIIAVIICSITAVLLQILSNLANDYGDFKKGVDGSLRQGPKRTMQSGDINEMEMLIGITLIAGAALLSGSILIFYVARLTWTELAVFAILGIAAVLAALLYTLGKHPYGYQGLGDLFCFLFFGWAAVAGTYYLATKNLDFSILLPATTMGFMSNAVLNINNMRDYESDKASGKNSIVVLIGLKKAFIYHCILIIGAFISLSIFCLIKQLPLYCYSFWLLTPLYFKDILTLHQSTKDYNPQSLDPLLPRQVLKTFLLTLLFGTTLIIKLLS